MDKRISKSTLIETFKKDFLIYMDLLKRMLYLIGPVILYSRETLSKSQCLLKTTKAVVWRRGRRERKNHTNI
jgi:hypothetical protein